MVKKLTQFNRLHVGLNMDIGRYHASFRTLPECFVSVETVHFSILFDLYLGDLNMYLIMYYSIREVGFLYWFRAHLQHKMKAE